MTVSNLSQAIRFLVDNEFLENIELRPGQAEEKMIEIVSTTDVEPTDLQAGQAAPTMSPAAPASL